MTDVPQQLREDKILHRNLDRLVGQIFRLLPAREEGEDFLKPMDTIIVELSGLADVIDDSKLTDLLTLISKLRGLRSMDVDSDFMLYRRTILEACSLTSKLRDSFGR